MAKRRPSGQKLYYSIGEVAELLDVNPSLIRYWEKEFPQVKPRKNRRGVRMFTKEDIETLQNIRLLVKGQGYTLEGARKLLDSKEQKAEGDVMSLLNRLRSLLVEIKRSLPEPKS